MRWSIRASFPVSFAGGRRFFPLPKPLQLRQHPLAHFLDVVRLYLGRRLGSSVAVHLEQGKRELVRIFDHPLFATVLAADQFLVPTNARSSKTISSLW